jgi:type 1 glutamine amidotransferase
VTRKDQPLSPAERAVTELGISSGLYRADCTQDCSTITKEQLDGYDLVLFYTTGNLPLKDDVRDYLINEWAKKKGHGFIGTHSATDTYLDHQPYWEMLGGVFDGHPWKADETVTIKVHDRQHPASKPLGDELTIQDEIYKYRNWQPEKVRVLASLDFEKTKHREPYHVPILWVKDYGQGKVMNMSLGHNEHVWQNPKFLQSLQGGIEWMLGKQPGDATPNPEVSKAEDEKAKRLNAGG